MTKRFKKFLVGGLIILSVCLSTGALIKMNRLKAPTEIGNESFTTAIVKEDGKLDFKTNEAICLRKNMDIKDLSIEVKEDSDLDYTLYFYDEDNSLLGQVTKTEYETDSSIPEGATKFNIAIINEADEDGEISFTEMYDYLKDIKIVIEK